MKEQISRYYQLKNKQKEIEDEMSALKEQIMSYCAEQDVREASLGSYKVRLVLQERREYDDAKLYDALPDKEIWRLLSRADSAKIASLLKLNVLSEQQLEHTYDTKEVTRLLVDRK
ncbi:hypothetical protein M6D81_12980 [Paenibacillus sp. J5C_2022]|uniref:hypothetical protein n=1 Tax=Paenibacillus sp. J5C2022 TaxID=2977129 RepID=UPI0021CF3C2C|nr:hypothetical protein [Paenibacillus sp. J5C2022]MCU6709613.1 hypothetical protein [Paenibacillus sp. J5C2022]